MKQIKEFLDKFNYIFNKRQRRKLVLLLLMIIGATALELLGVAAIQPFINVVMSPEIIDRTDYLKWIYDLFQFQNVNYFIALMGVALIVIYVVKNIVVSVMYYLQYYFTFSNQKEIASRMLHSYMRQSYSFHLQRNSADLIRNINSDLVNMFQGILSILQLITECMVCIVLGVFLFIKDKSITMGVILFLVVFMALFAKKFKRYLTRIGEEDRHYASGIVKWLQQSFGGMKETKILGREDYFFSQFNDNYENWAERERKYRFMQVAPRPVMEMMCITALMSVIILKLLNGTNSSYFVGILGVFAIAAFRLLPSFNRMAHSFSVLMFSMPAFDAVYEELKEIDSLSAKEMTQDKETLPLAFEREIKVQSLSFRYPHKEEYVLHDVNIVLKKNQSIAFIGPSGAGKTTLADIILGVLEPSGGKILVDGVDAVSNHTAWQKNLGYIPQNIYLMDDTIRNNIIYGAGQSEASDEKLWRAVEEAQMKEFVMGLEKGLDTVIGESGIRISGGQRQRIGIARALYDDPDVLVLDEATSALDNETEAAVMEAINHLSGQKTLIIIAHRLTTIENCDIVYEVKDGGVEIAKKR